MDEKKRLENIKKGKALAEKCVAKHGMYGHRPIEMNQLEVRNPAMYKLAYCARKRSTIKKLIGKKRIIKCPVCRCEFHYRIVRWEFATVKYHAGLPEGCTFQFEHLIPPGDVADFYETNERKRGTNKNKANNAWKQRRILNFLKKKNAGKKNQRGEEGEEADKILKILKENNAILKKKNANAMEDEDEEDEEEEVEEDDEDEGYALGGGPLGVEDDEEDDEEEEEEALPPPHVPNLPRNVEELDQMFDGRVGQEMAQNFDKTIPGELPLDESVGDGWRPQSPRIEAKKMQKKEGMGPKKLKIRPKKNQSAFDLWRGEMIDKMKQRGHSNLQAARIAEERWIEMTPDEKQQYQMKALQDKIRYERQLREYRGEGSGQNTANEKQQLQTLEEGPSTSQTHPPTDIGPPLKKKRMNLRESRKSKSKWSPPL